MAIFSISDIVIAITLVINALALVSSRVPSHDHKGLKVQSAAKGGGEGRGAETGGKSGTNDNADGESDNLLSSSSSSSSAIESVVPVPTTRSESTSLNDRLRQLIYGVRKLSCLILFWNVTFTVLMILVFER